MKPVDYQVDHPYSREKGNVAYTYLMTGGGLMVTAQNDFMIAGVMIAPAVVRGLCKRETGIELKHGKVPINLFHGALRAFYSDPERELYLGITWRDGYHLWRPEQMAAEGGVKYRLLDDVVMDLHSHGTMAPFFSKTDDEDEQGLRLYGVTGRMRDLPCQVKLRVGVYGYFQTVLFEDVFDGPCPVEELNEA